MIRAVIFDLDDTLYREPDYVAAAFHHASEYLAKKYGLDTEEIFQDAMAFLERDGRGHIFNVLCEKYQINEPISNLVEKYRETRPVLTLYPDAEKLLQYLKTKQIKTGVLTDGMASVQHTKIECLGLQNRIDAIMVTDDLGEDEQGKRIMKPNVIPYQKCLEELHCPANEAIYIGDNPKKDFIGARSLGMKTVRIKRPIGGFMDLEAASGYEADDTITDLMQICTIQELGL